MKNVKKISIIICIILCFFVSNSFAATGKVNTEATRVRKEANTTSTILTIAYQGDTVEIVEVQGDWYKIKFDGYVGFVKKEFISSENNMTTSTENAIAENKVSENTTNENNVVTNNGNTVDNITNTSNTISSDTKINDEENNSTTDNKENKQLSDNKYMTNSSVNVRIIPSILSKTISQIESSKEITKILETNNWVKVTDGNITGWILQSKISIVTKEQTNSTQSQEKQPEEKKDETEKEEELRETTESNINKTGKINVETAKVREKASSSATVIAFLDYNDKVTITAEDGDWYKVTSDDISGYVNKKLITVSEGVSSRSLQEERTIDNEDEVDNTTVSQEINNVTNQALSNAIQNNPKGNQVVEFAKQFLGCSYVLGGKNPTTGFDCSGFTKYVYSNFGYTLGNTAATQNSLGTEIARENMQPGDLILFYDDSNTKIGHTGIYLGEGSFIHAANPQRGVVTDNLNTNSYYNTRFITAKRIVE